MKLSMLHESKNAEKFVENLGKIREMIANGANASQIAAALKPIVGVGKTAIDSYIAKYLTSQELEQLKLNNPKRKKLEFNSLRSKIEQLVDDGYSMSDIARELDIPNEWMVRNVHKLSPDYEERARANNGRKPVKDLDVDLDEMRDLIDHGMHQTSVADYFGITIWAAIKLIDSLGNEYREQVRENGLRANRSGQQSGDRPLRQLRSDVDRRELLDLIDQGFTLQDAAIQMGHKPQMITRIIRDEYPQLAGRWTGVDFWEWLTGFPDEKQRQILHAIRMKNRSA